MGRVQTLIQMRANLIKKYNLSEDEQKETLPSGGKKFFNRMAWAKTYLMKAGLIKSTKRGHFIITKRGKDLLKTNPEKIDNGILSDYKEFLNFKNGKRDYDHK